MLARQNNARDNTNMLMLVSGNDRADSMKAGSSTAGVFLKCFGEVIT